MIEDMVDVLKKEQTEDESKKEYCATQMDKTEDAKKSHQQSLSDLNTAIDETTDQIATTKAELEALSDGIHELDKKVQEATVQRKEENEDYNNLIASDTQAKSLL